MESCCQGGPLFLYYLLWVHVIIYITCTILGTILFQDYMPLTPSPFCMAIDQKQMYIYRVKIKLYKEMNILLDIREREAFGDCAHGKKTKQNGKS